MSLVLPRSFGEAIGNVSEDCGWIVSPSPFEVTKRAMSQDYFVVVTSNSMVRSFVL